MKMKWFCLATLLVLSAVSGVFAQVTEFPYNGRLNDGGSPANGIYDLDFRLYDGGGSIISTVRQEGIRVTNGVFSVTLDFGIQPYGAYRELEISVRTNMTGGEQAKFTTLSPRQPITAVPNAIQAGLALSATSAGTATSVTGPIAANQLTGTISPVNIATGSITSVLLATGSVTTVTLADNAITLPKLQTVFDGQLARTIADPFNTNVYAIPGVPWDEQGNSHRFGASVAPLGSFLIVGSPGRDYYDSPYTFCIPFGGCPTFYGHSWEDAGAVYLLPPDGSPITAIAPLPIPDIEFGFSVAAMSNGRILVGAPGAGKAYEVDTSGFVHRTLQPFPSGVRFGQAVAGLGNGGVAVSDPNLTNGVVRVFAAGGQYAITVPAAGISQFGSALAAVGNSSLLVGTPSTISGGNAFLFYTPSSVSGPALLMTTFTNHPVVGGFGAAVAAFGVDKVIIGASGGAGSAYLFATNGALLATFNNPFPATDGGFGFSVAAVGTDKIVIGAQSGRAFLFDTGGRLLGVFNNPTPGYAPAAVSSFGSNQVAVAFRDALPSGFGRGAVHVFNLDGPDFIPGLSVERGSITTDTLADGAVTSAKIGGVLNPSQIPNLDASKITSGVLDAARIPALDASKISSGTLADGQLSPNVALRSGNTFSGSQNFTGGTIITLDNMVDIYAKNSSGGVEGLLTGRWSDDATYFTYGSGGLFIRNNVSTPTMYINSSGNVGIGNFTPNNLLVVGTGGAFCNGTTWVNGSDRNAKEEFVSIDPQEVLDKVSALPISEWRYKADGKGIRHLGPMAQDFYDAFKVGSDDKHIATVDADGVALAAIQGLNQKVDGGTKRANERIEKLEAENTELKKQLEEIKAALQKLVPEK